MADKKFELGDYIEVKDRIAIFYELYQDGRLVTSEVTLTSEPDGVPRVMVRALAYRSEDDTLPGVGYSWLELPGKTPYTRGSEVENAETSAWGRAIAALGILIDRSIASAQEVQNKQEDRHTPVAPLPREEEPDIEGGLIGTVEVGKKPVDMEMRATPDGPAYGFKLKNGRKAYQVLAVGPFAEALSLAGLATDDRVQVWGTLEMVPWERAGQPMPPFARITPVRIKTDEWTLPAEEAVSLPLFDEAEALEIAAREMAEAGIP
jgi:hypothetical protein